MSLIRPKEKKFEKKKYDTEWNHLFQTLKEKGENDLRIELQTFDDKDLKGTISYYSLDPTQKVPK